ncbi:MULTISPECIES: APC family permease [Salinibaculum]|uniref:APC family permease n=1 Tax=Salinibaculum TaxID=2732368 RepID=UPI0030D271FA
MAELKQELGLFGATVYGVGLILGAGIYAIIGEAAGIAGESVVLSFALAAVIATLTGLSYAELASLYPRGEGDYIYVRAAFGNKRLSELTALLRVLVGVVSAAAVALAFAGYLSSFLPGLPTVVVAIGLVVATAAVNYWGIETSARLNVLFTAVEVVGLLVIVAIGMQTWGTVDTLDAPRGSVGTVQAAFLVFFAYIGFGSLVNIAEETRDATTRIPQAILLSIGITTVLYIAVALSAVGVVDSQTLGASASPLALVAERGWGSTAGSLLAVIALFSTTNTVLILQISTSRMLYGVSKAEYHSFPRVFSRIHPDRRTPHYAVVLVGVVTVGFSLLGDVGVVAGLANLVLLVVFVLINGALLALRYREPERERGFRAPGNVGRLSLTAVGGVLTSLGFVAFSLAQLVGVL